MIERFVTRSTSEYTVGRATAWRLRWGRAGLFQFRTPDEDPYGLDFDQHDDSNYTTESWTLIVGRLKLAWTVKSSKPA